MDDVVLRGLLQVVGISLVPVALVGAALHSGEAWRWWRQRRHRHDVEEQVATVLPLERVAADLRRLYPAVHSPRPGTPMVKHRGTVLAYDERLAAAAGALDLLTTLPQLRVDGFDREVERLRLEHLLGDAGLRLWPSLPEDPAA